MFIIVSVFSIIYVYKSTISINTSNEEIAKSVFQHSSNSEFQVTKEFLGYKSFIKDEGEYIELKSVQKVFYNSISKF